MPSSHPLVERLRSPDAPAPLKAAAARGALPLPPEDLVEALFHLRREQDLQADIRRTLETLPVETLADVAGDGATPGPMLDFLARACFSREEVLERLAQNPSTLDATLRLLAQHGNESILEFLSFNQVRLARDASLLQAMLANPRCTPSIGRRLNEIRELHDQELARARTAAPVVPPPVPAAPEPLTEDALAAPEAAPPDPAAPAAEAADQEPAEALLDEVAPEATLEDLADLDVNARILQEMAEDDVSEEELRLAQKLLTMTIPEKVQLALKGDRNSRMVLIRDSAKMVQESVIHSPKITDNEIEQISKMRSISVDVIRALVAKREAMKMYAVVSNLVKNPKTPVPDAMTLMQRLQDRDLTMITKDKNVPDMVRRHAAIVLQKRKPKGVKKPGGGH